MFGPPHSKMHKYNSICLFKAADHIHGCVRTCTVYMGENTLEGAAILVAASSLTYLLEKDLKNVSERKL